MKHSFAEYYTTAAVVVIHFVTLQYSWPAFMQGSEPKEWSFFGKHHVPTIFGYI